MIKTYCVAAVLLMTLLGGCASQIDPALVKQHEALIQRMQSRVFETGDNKVVARGVIATLQDMNFVINTADIGLGAISAKKFGDYPIEISVTIQPMSNSLILVHGNARYQLKTIEDPAIYEQLFSSLEKSVSLVAHPID